MPGAAEKWDRIYSEALEAPKPCRVLIENAHLLPASGFALDLASGLGGNALFMAERGLNVLALDISPVAVSRLKASGKGLNIDAMVFDVEKQSLPEETFDVIAVSRFLDRRLAEPIMQSLKPSGLLFYQTFTRESVSNSGPGNPDYRLASNELLALFGPLRILFYREEGRVGDLSQGFRDEACLIGQKVA